MDKFGKILQKIHILVVDDMGAIRNLVNGCLKELGAERVAMAPNGLAAWTLLQTTSVDMIICDWDMPKMSGLELLEHVRASEKHSHIPFLMLTAAVEKERVVKAIKAGANDYLTKPFQPKELEYRIIKLLRKIKLD